MYMGDYMNWKKKTEYITFRATEEVKEAPSGGRPRNTSGAFPQLVEQIVSRVVEQKEKT